MAMEQYFEGALAHNASSEEGQKPSEKCKPVPDPADANPTGSFECNICLDTVQDPVVTMCGHLFCWPCIYKWLDLQKNRIPTEEDQDLGQPQCPVCKAEVSEATLVPLYGRGLNKKASKGKDRRLVLMIPKRPLAPGSGLETPRTPRIPDMTPRVAGQQLHYQAHNFGSSPTSYHSPYASLPSPSMLSPGAQLANLMDPVMGMFGEAVYERAFGGSAMNVYGNPNSYNFVGTTSPRIRRHIVQADRSLARICFFFFCCVLLCLMSF